jgi:hypothetical protein
MNQNGDDKYFIDKAVDYQFFADIFVLEGNYGDTLNKNNSTYIDTLFFPFSLDVETNTKSIEFNINNLLNDYVDVNLPKRRLDAQQNLVELDKQSGKPKHLLSYFVVFGDSYKFQINGERKRNIKGISSVKWVQNGGLDSLKPYDLNKYV